MIDCALSVRRGTLGFMAHGTPGGRPMRTALIALVVMLLASTALTADRYNLPAQFAGNWCLDNSGDDKGPSTYRLGRCLNDNSDSWLTVHADGSLPTRRVATLFRLLRTSNQISS